MYKSILTFYIIKNTNRNVINKVKTYKKNAKEKYWKGTIYNFKNELKKKKYELKNMTI